MMKKYFVFIISFASLCMVYQVLSGMILTESYTPKISTPIMSDSPQGRGSAIPLLVILITATIAYILSQRTFRTF